MQPKSLQTRLVNGIHASSPQTKTRTPPAPTLTEFLYVFNYIGQKLIWNIRKNFAEVVFTALLQFVEVCRYLYYAQLSKGPTTVF